MNASCVHVRVLIWARTCVCGGLCVLLTSLRTFYLHTFIPDDFLSNQRRSLNASQKQAEWTRLSGKREQMAPSRRRVRGRSLQEGGACSREGFYRFTRDSRDFHLCGTFDLPLKGAEEPLVLPAPPSPSPKLTNISQ